jgi:hypothetical protein
LSYEILKRPMLKPETIALIEEQYHCSYVLDACLRTDHGWCNQPSAIFWNETKHPNGSNYMAVTFTGDGRIVVSDGYSAVEKPIVGLLVDDVVIYSKYRYDFFEYHGVFVDGGRDYLRFGADDLSRAKRVKMRVVGPNVEIEVV